MKTVIDHEKIQRALTRHCNAINELLEEVQKEYPEACMFLDGSHNLCIVEYLPEYGDGYDSEKMLFDATLNESTYKHLFFNNW